MSLNRINSCDDPEEHSDLILDLLCAHIPEISMLSGLFPWRQAQYPLRHRLYRGSHHRAGVPFDTLHSLLCQWNGCNAGAQEDGFHQGNYNHIFDNIY